VVRHRSKPLNGQRYRVLNTKPFLIRDTAQVIRIEYSPNQSAFLALVRFLKNGFLSYLPVEENTKIGDYLYLNPSFEKISSSGFILNLNKKNQQIGPLYTFPKGAFVNNISTKPFGPFSFCRGAGTSAKITAFSNNYQMVELMMPSGKIIQLNSSCFACSGQVSNSGHFLYQKTKASQNRYLGFRPSVRGVAMNPVDHPMGGGEGKSSGGRPSVSPWGKLTKGGFRTIKKVVLKRKQKIKKKFNH
jgi:large subunit ribosomal protein L2